MTRIPRLAAASAALVLVLPAGAALAGDRDDDRARNALIGAGIGAIAGAMLGDGDTTYVIGGAVAGAAVGYAATSDDDRRRYDDRRYNARYSDRYQDSRYDRRYRDARYDRRHNPPRYRGNAYGRGW